MDQADAVTDATGNARLANSLTFLIAAYQDELGTPTLIAGGLREAAARADGMFLTTWNMQARSSTTGSACTMTL
jgi:hypothetical protein